jgi:hypothetical protein
MGLCVGNSGNLLQHWVLCETLEVLAEKGIEHLHLTCTHSMAPWSIPKPVDYSKNHSPKLHQRKYFDRVRSRLATNKGSIFENCWRDCSGTSGVPYPSSAVIANKLWTKKLSLFLCEIDAFSASEIDAWMKLPEISARITAESKLHCGNWRAGLTTQVFSNSNADCFVIELDPMQFECGNPLLETSRNGALLYPDDIERVLTCIQSLNKPLVIQVTSYNTQNNNSLNRVESHIVPIFSNAGFVLEASVSPHGSMRSWVFSRNLQLWNQPSLLDHQFNQWLPR